MAKCTSRDEIEIKIHPQRQNVTTSMVGLKKKTVTYAKISPEMVKPRDIAGNAEEEKQEEEIKILKCLEL